MNKRDTRSKDIKPSKEMVEWAQFLFEQYQKEKIKTLPKKA